MLRCRINGWRHNIRLCRKILRKNGGRKNQGKNNFSKAIHKKRYLATQKLPEKFSRARVVKIAQS